MTQDGPGDVAVLQLTDRDLSGEGTVGLVKDVLSSHLNVRRQMLPSEEEVECWRSDDNFGVGIELG